MARYGSVVREQAAVEVKLSIAAADVGEAVEPRRRQSARGQADPCERGPEEREFPGYMVECEGRQIGPFFTTEEAVRRGEEAFGDRPLSLRICGPTPPKSQMS